MGPGSKLCMETKKKLNGPGVECTLSSHSGLNPEATAKFTKLFWTWTCTGRNRGHFQPSFTRGAREESGGVSFQRRPQAAASARPCLSDGAPGESGFPKPLKQWAHSPPEQYSRACRRRWPWWPRCRSPPCTSRSLPVCSGPRGPTVRCPVSDLCKKHRAANIGGQPGPKPFTWLSWVMRCGVHTAGRAFCTHPSKGTRLFVLSG